jgi:ribosomal protein S18 acetylase RimI-like enzyme
MRIRPLEPGDLQVYRELMLQAYALDADAFTTTAQERASASTAWWLGRMCDPQRSSQAFGAFHDGQLVGAVAIEFESRAKVRHKAHLVGMFVAQAARGLGAGQALIQAAIAHARQRSEVKLITLTVTDGNDAAIALYQRAGFRPFGLEPMAIFTGADYKSKLHMQLQLAAADR